MTKHIHTDIRIIAAVVDTEAACNLDGELSITRGGQIEIVAEIVGPDVPFGQVRKRTVVAKHFDAFKLFEAEEKEFIKDNF